MLLFQRFTINQEQLIELKAENKEFTATTLVEKRIQSKLKPLANCFLNKLNNFPKRIEHQCFLLDASNKVLVVGNPLLNPQIWTLYKQIINKNKEVIKDKNTKIKIEKSMIELNNLTVDDSLLYSPNY